MPPSSDQPPQSSEIKLLEQKVEVLQLELKKRDLEWTTKDKSQWFSSPVLIALVGVFGTLLGGTFQGLFNLIAEQQKFESNLIVQDALKQPTPDDAVARIKFLRGLGLFKIINARGDIKPSDVPIISQKDLVQDVTFKNPEIWKRLCSSIPQPLQATEGVARLGNCRLFQAVGTIPGAKYSLSFRYRNGCLHAIGADGNPVEPGKDQDETWTLLKHNITAISNSTNVMLEACNGLSGSEGKARDAEVSDVHFFRIP